MGVYLKWKPATGSSYTNTYIYRSSTETGTYTEISSQSYSDLNYYDIDGTTGYWYKVRFFDSVATKWSEFSDAWQGGTWRGYCTVEDIRDVTNLTAADITDGNLCRLITLSCQQLNRDVQVYIEEERIFSIPGWEGVKTNDVDGTNVTYYTVHYPIGDSNNTFKVDVSDITVYEIDSSTTPSTKTVLTVSSITPNSGQFVVATPASTSDKTLFVTYYCSPLSMSDPHPLIRMAAMQLTAAWAYQKINVGKSPKFKLGNVQIARDMDSFKVWMQRYKETLLEISARSMVDYGEAPDTPGDSSVFNPTPVQRNKNR